MSSITNIPSDIKREILVRLPAECLIRARAVSKGWRAVIDDPCFARAHNFLQQKLSSNIIIQKKIRITSISSKKIMNYELTKKFGSSCYSVDLEALIGCSSRHQAITAVPLDLDVICDGPAARFSSCNGLVLTYQKYSRFTMWNPLTRERLDLPKDDFSDAQAYGLGYDSANDDYKAVVIMRKREIQVYSLKSDSWTRSIINHPCDGDWRCPKGPGVFVCGALNWLSVGEWGKNDKIVSLHLGTEKYSLLQLPPHLKTTWNGNLIVLGGRLAVYGYRNKKRHLDVWVMKDYGEEDSWFKLFSIENEKNNNVSMWRGFLRPSAFTMNEKLVFLQDEDRFFLFDVETNSLKWVEINGSIIKHDLNVCAQQMFVGTIFRLHTNCGGGGDGRMSCTEMKKKKAPDLELLFCIRDADGMYNVPCCERGCRLSDENEELEVSFSFEDGNMNGSIFEKYS